MEFVNCARCGAAKRKLEVYVIGDSDELKYSCLECPKRDPNDFKVPPQMIRSKIAPPPPSKSLLGSIVDFLTVRETNESRAK